MKKYVVLNKPVGKTPLEAIQEWKTSNPEYTGVPASYAGRLDPMASGKLLVLLGEECKKQQKYTKLDKEYEVEILLDIESDTGDILGLVGTSGKETIPKRTSLKKIFKAESGTHLRQYPIFSSKTVNGKPLFLYALEDTLNTIKIPVHKERIYSIKLLSTESITKEALHTRIFQTLALTPLSNEPSKILGADFRIKAVTAAWEKVFSALPNREFVVLRIRVACATGTYMRTLAPQIGQSFGTFALALSIHRTKIGRCLTLSPLSFWLRAYK